MQHDVILYWCTSAYPVRAENLYLREIKNLVSKYEEHVDSIGFSGHHDGIAMDIMAYCYGARYFERHFTLDHNWKGTDHKASLEPSGLTRLIRDLGMAENADNNKDEEISNVEMHNRNFHKYQPK